MISRGALSSTDLPMNLRTPRLNNLFAFLLLSTGSLPLIALDATAPSQTMFDDNGFKDLSIGWSKSALTSSKKTAEGLRVADPSSAKGRVRTYERDWHVYPDHGAGPEPGISGIWMMGQSLCDGSESLPVVTAEETGWGNLAFQRGVRTWLPKDNSATPDLRPAELFKLVPL